jgi:hypothetical protein
MKFAYAFADFGSKGKVGSAGNAGKIIKSGSLPPAADGVLSCQRKEAAS